MTVIRLPSTPPCLLVIFYGRPAIYSRAVRRDVPGCLPVLYLSVSVFVGVPRHFLVDQITRVLWLCASDCS